MVVIKKIIVKLAFKIKKPSTKDKIMEEVWGTPCLVEETNYCKIFGFEFYEYYTYGRFIYDICKTKEVNK